LQFQMTPPSAASTHTSEKTSKIRSPVMTVPALKY
jgi:hypothetical protein